MGWLLVGVAPLLGGCALFEPPPTPGLENGYAATSIAAGRLERETVDPLRAFADPALRRSLSKGRALTLHAAFERALERAPELEIAARGVVRARVERIRAWAQLLPRAALVYERFEQQRGLPVLAGGLRTDELQPALDTTRLAVRWPLFDGLSRLLDPARSAHAEHAARARHEAARLLVIAAVAGCYFDVLEADALTEIEEEWGKRIEAWAGAVQAQAVVEALISAERAEIAEHQARWRTRGLQARARLSLLVGAPVLGTVRSVHLATHPLAKRLAALSLPSVVEAGFARRPDVRALRHELEAERIAARMALLESQLPAAEIDSNLYLARGGLRGATRWDVAILLRYRLFEGFAASARALEATSRREEGEARREERLRAVAEEITTLWFAVRFNREAKDALRERLEQTQRALEQRASEASDLVGALAQLELLRRLVAAKRALARARIRFERSLFALALATGDAHWIEKAVRAASAVDDEAR